MPADNAKIPRPYRSVLFHPHATILDWICNWLSVLLIPIWKMTACKPDASPETVSVVRRINRMIERLMLPMVEKFFVWKWAKLAKCPIGEYICTIPVNKHILSDWGICPAGTAPLAKRDQVRLIVRFPTCLLASDATISGETKGGFVKVDDLGGDLSSFAPDATMLIQFYCGGFVIGHAKDPLLLKEATEVVAEYHSRLGPKERAKPLVTISVDYALAPEHPFPNAVIEALSVIDYLLSRNPQRKLHIAGSSAGGGLTLTAGLETAKCPKYAGRVVSLQAHAPYVDPIADSMSYYEMSKAAKYASGEWLRWAWQANLGMEKAPTLDDDKTPTTQALLRRGSNRSEWEKSRWSKPPFNRLARPIDGISTLTANCDGDFPIILVFVNQADSLYSEGKDLAKAMQEAGLKVSLLEHTGIHMVGSLFDFKGNAQRNALWADALFGKPQ